MNRVSGQALREESADLFPVPRAGPHRSGLQGGGKKVVALVEANTTKTAKGADPNPPRKQTDREDVDEAAMDVAKEERPEPSTLAKQTRVEVKVSAD